MPRLCWLFSFAFLLSGCSVQRLAVNALADALAESGDVYASDEDPELVRDALPFALKTTESLLSEAPDHPGLLLAACQGFTQYAYAFIEPEAEKLRWQNFSRSEALRARALKMYLRARGYCLRALENRRAGITDELIRQTGSSLAEFGAEDLDLLYWSGASWGAAIAAGIDRPELVADLPAARALLERVLELDEAYNHGTIHEAFISLESLPAEMGGSAKRARQHYRRSIELSAGSNASPHVTLGAGLAVKEQNRAEFEDLMALALAVNVDRRPEIRLANLLAQRRARWLLDQADDLFLDSNEDVSQDP